MSDCNGNKYLSAPILNRRNYHLWAIKMKAYLKGLGLWEIIENDANPTALLSNPH